MIRLDQNRPDAVVLSPEDMIETAERFLPLCGVITLSRINGVEYALCAEGDGVEVVDTVEDDSYRRETFPDVRSAIAGFMIDGRPLSDFLTGIGMYFMKTNRTKLGRDGVLSN